MQVMTTGFDADEKPILHVLAYVSFQELATASRTQHRPLRRRSGVRAVAQPGGHR